MQLISEIIYNNKVNVWRKVGVAMTMREGAKIPFI